MPDMPNMDTLIMPNMDMPNMERGTVPDSAREAWASSGTRAVAREVYTQTRVQRQPERAT